jgi:hypothetical protein
MTGRWRLEPEDEGERPCIYNLSDGRIVDRSVTVTICRAVFSYTEVI